HAQVRDDQIGALGLVLLKGLLAISSQIHLMVGIRQHHRQQSAHTFFVFGNQQSGHGCSGPPSSTTTDPPPRDKRRTGATRLKTIEAQSAWGARKRQEPAVADGCTANFPCALCERCPYFCFRPLPRAALDPSFPRPLRPRPSHRAAPCLVWVAARVPDSDGARGAGVGVSVPNGSGGGVH